MEAEMIHYYFLKNLINRLPSEVLNSVTLDDKKIFYYANILSMYKYYSINSLRKDKSLIGEKIIENFNSFYPNLLINISEHKNIDNLILAYSFLAYKILDEFLESYINNFKDYKETYDEAINMLDCYLYNKDTNNLLYKTNYYKIFGKFNYDLDVEKLMKSAAIKSTTTIGFNPYYIRCNKKRNRFYRFYKNIFVKFVIYFIDIFRKNKRNKKYYYKAKFNEKLLNLDHNSFEVNNKRYNYSFMELLDYLLDEVINSIKMVNDYLTNGKDKEIRDYFNIPSDKKM